MKITSSARESSGRESSAREKEQLYSALQFGLPVLGKFNEVTNHKGELAYTIDVSSLLLLALLLPLPPPSSCPLVRVLCLSL